MSRTPDRWPARPVLGAVVRFAAIVVPVALAVVVALELAWTLPAAATWPGRLAWWAAVLGGSTVALVFADRGARRLIPLAVLLDLALVFPGHAPSRMRAARGTSVRELENRLAALRAEGATGRPIDAAETLVTLVGILGLHDRRTRGHSERVRAFTDLLTAELGLNDDARVRIRWAALVHDIGKLSVPSPVLNGGRELDDEGWAALRGHPHEGRRMAAGLMPWLGEWGTAVEQHHERWDGAGYPEGLAGEQIGYGARIVAVADAFDTMTSVRSYNKARSAAAAREELAQCAGTQFDPSVVRAFLAVSLPRLSWVLGPVTWLAQLPFVVAADRAGRSVKAGATAAGIAGLVLFGALPGPGDGLNGSTGRAVIAGAASPGTGTGAVTDKPLALPFTEDDPTTAPTTAPTTVTTTAPRPPRPTVVSPVPANRASPRPSHVAAPVPAPVPAPPVVTPSAPTPVASPSPVVASPSPSPSASPPVVSAPSPSPAPGNSGGTKAKPGKHKGNGKGNGHFGQNNASHSAHWSR